VQSQVRFIRVTEMVLVMVRGSFCALWGSVPENAWEALVQSQVRFNRICGHLTHGNPAEVFPALGFGTLQKEL
jgi:hypothetical protein